MSNSNLQQNTAHDDKLIELWKKYTIPPFSFEKDFFQSGGDSLSAINLIVDIQNTFATRISLEAFMRNPTIQYLIAQATATVNE